MKTLSYLLFLVLLISIKSVFAHNEEDSLIIGDYKFERIEFELKPTLYKSMYSGGSLTRYPNKNDSINVNKLGYLANESLTPNNYREFYDVALSFWKLGKDEIAERMFLRILNSEEENFSKTNFYASDVLKDSSVNDVSNYGYGSFTSHPKNEIALCLSKIYIAQNDFSKALFYLEEAVNKYKVTYTCGMGYYIQKSEYDFLYGTCYKELNENQKIIDLFLPTCLVRNDDFVVDAIKNIYSTKEIETELDKAINSLTFEAFDFPSLRMNVTYINNKEVTDSSTYYLGKTKMKIFGLEIESQNIDLEDGERLTRDKVIEEFKKSDFYTDLMSDYEG
ncbi:hypothetical protein WAF17_16870 [Bernardetia sp. ABR2-2B]|uniref:hypothetical protein n=1 Tax=Bernardetia sp. ABR2-2B TaxID=3127472 RepID=UPI0030D0F08E